MALRQTLSNLFRKTDRNQRYSSKIGRQKSFRRLAFLEQLEDRRLMTATPHLLKDINVNTAASSNPGPFVEMGGMLYFSAGDEATGFELWKSDGTESGTALVADIAPGPDNSLPGSLTAVGDEVYFSANDGTNGFELWKSDGTAAGTVRVADIASGIGSSNPYGMTAIGGNIVFTANDGATGNELWATDGTEAGTHQIIDLIPGLASSSPGLFVSFNNELYYSAHDDGSGYDLWRTDGTAAGTEKFFDQRSSELTVSNGNLYFVADDSSGYSRLWKYDGTDTQIMIAAPTQPADLVDVDGNLFFFDLNGLWKTDGTDVGTVFVAQAPFDPTYFVEAYREPIDVNGTLFFSLADSENGRTLWKSDGTAIGTEFVATLLQSYDTFQYALHPTVANDTLFLVVGDDIHQFELWKSDGTTAGTGQVADTETGPGKADNPMFLTDFQGSLYFNASESTTSGTELWKSDGTETGTTLVKDINGSGTGSNPRRFMESNGLVYFNSPQIWQSDGTSNGTVQVTSGNSQLVADYNDQLYFSAGNELWKTDGTQQGTSLVSVLNASGVIVSGSSAVVVNNSLYFMVGSLVWRTDGTDAGTVPLAPGSFLTAHSLANVGGKLHFVARDSNGDSELWSSDGTDEGTMRVADIRLGQPSSNPANIVDLNGTAYFTANDGIHGVELWKSDGTEAGTMLVADLKVGASSSFPSNLVVIDGNLYFSADSGLWKSDGTTEGTIRLGNGNAAFITAAGGQIFFRGTDSVAGSELWKTDGTPAGTVRIADISAGIGGSNIRNLTELNGVVYFTADDGIHGNELWSSDGTEVGTVLVSDIRLGAKDGIRSSSDVTLLNVEGKLFFPGDDGYAGEELWVLSDIVNHPPTVSGPVVVSTSTLDSAFSFDLLSGATDPDAGDVLAVTNLALISGDARGVSIVGNIVSVDPLSYQHLPIGLVAFVEYAYQIVDGNGGSVEQSTSIAIFRENNPPVVTSAVNMSSLEDDSPFMIDLLAGTIDLDPGDVLSIADLDGSGAGISVLGSSLSIDPSAYNFLPAGAQAENRFTYRIVDSYGASVPQVATIIILGLNDSPTAKVDQFIVAQGSSSNVLQLTANDVDPDSDLLLIQSVTTTARNATVTISADLRSALYTPRTPTSTGTDSFSYTIVDAAGATSTTTVSVTILANTVVAESTTLANEVLIQQSTANEPLDVVVNISPASYSSVISAINSLPPVEPGGQTVFVTLAISDGVYPGAVLNPPAGVVIILNGFNGGITLVGASPALTVSSGEVLIENGVVLTNSTDAPTILVTGGHLKIRNSTIEESTNFARAAIQIVGGTVDLGTVASPGGNALVIHGEGDFIINTSGTTVPAIGNSYLTDGESNDAPIIGAIQGQVYTDSAITVQVQAVDPENDVLSYSVSFVSKSGAGAVNAPTDYFINSNGLFSWTPGVGQLGDYTFEVLVSDGLLQTTRQFTASTVRLVDGVLTIFGSQARDQIEIDQTSHGKKSNRSSTIEIEIRQSGASRTELSFDTQDITRIVVYGQLGDDQIKAKEQLSVPLEIYGGSGDDRIDGGDADDLLYGDDGDDRISGGAGNDIVFGGAGNDRLNGGSDEDCQSANDILVGGDGNDEIFGGRGADVLFGGLGSDLIHGNSGGDLLIGGITIFDDSIAALRLIRDEWSAQRPYSDRIDNLRNGSGSILAGNGIRLDGSGSDATVFDDDEKDDLHGGSGFDWYFAQLAGDDNKDRVWKHRNEIIELLD